MPYLATVAMQRILFLRKNDREKDTECLRHKELMNNLSDASQFLTEHFQMRCVGNYQQIRVC